MNLREYLSAIAAGYDRVSVWSAGHLLLKEAGRQLSPLIPGGLRVEGSGGKGVATLTPWIGVFDPDETDTPQSGIYVVYIYSADMRRVVLTLNQGVTRLREEFGDVEARRRLARDATQVRQCIRDSDMLGTIDHVSFGTNRPLQRAYEAGNICAIDYDVSSMPNGAQLEADLAKFLRLYQTAVEVKRQLLQRLPGTISSASFQQNSAGPAADPLRSFAPKSDSEYVSHLVGRKLVKSRRHEALIRQYGDHVEALGLAPATNVHPRDMTLVSGTVEWLVEVKVVYGGNATGAVREAIGQLLQYRHFLYGPGSTVNLVAVFTEPVGDAYASLLDSLGIAAVWKAGAGWEGSQLAADGGVV